MSPEVVVVVAVPPPPLAPPHSTSLARSPSQVCNHPDLFEARQIDSPFVLPPLELRIGSHVLRSPVGFPAGFGGVGWEGRGDTVDLTEALGVGVNAAGGAGVGAGPGAVGGMEGVEGVSRLAKGVSRRLIAPLWAHDLGGEGQVGEGTQNTGVNGGGGGGDD